MTIAIPKPINLNDLFETEGGIIGAQIPRSFGAFEIDWIATDDSCQPIFTGGFGLVGINHDAFAGRTLTFDVGHSKNRLIARSTISIDLNAAGATGFAELAEWPWFRPVPDAAMGAIGKMIFVLS